MLLMFIFHPFKALIELFELVGQSFQCFLHFAGSLAHSPHVF